MFQSLVWYHVLARFIIRFNTNRMRFFCTCHFAWTALHVHLLTVFNYDCFAIGASLQIVTHSSAECFAAIGTAILVLSPPKHSAVLDEVDVFSFSAFLYSSSSQGVATLPEYWTTLVTADELFYTQEFTTELDCCSDVVTVSSILVISRCFLR